MARTSERHRIRLAATVSILAFAIFANPALPASETQVNGQDAGPTAEDPTASAESAGTPDRLPAAEGADIVVTGNRFGGRIRTESPTPIDSISASDLVQGGRTEVQNMLKATVPSFNTPRPSASGVGDFTTPPTLRGLSPGELLVLVNGKRRHPSSDLNNSNGIGRGDISYDFNAIPSAALGRVEVLRDGASAQYGSDAIAGVINLVLDATPGVRALATYGTTTEGDGEVIEVSASAGISLGPDAVLRVTAAYQDHNATNRAEPDTRQQYFGSNGTRTISGNFGSGTGLTPANGTLDPREANFDRNVLQQGEQPYQNRQVFYNLEAAAGENVTVYSFGGYNRLTGTTFNFFRRAGQDETVRSLYPDGYLPLQEVELTNYSTAFGLRGDNIASFGWDLSTVYGVSTVDGTYTNTNNVSLGNASPRDFYRGGSRFYQWTNNLDLSRELDLGMGEPLKLALGFEYREETWKQVAGELASYLNGRVPILDGPNAGRPAPVGAQPTPGNRPEDATSNDRSSYAAYAEIEQEFFDRLLISAALRHENFSDFGNTTDYRLASRFKLTDWLSARGSFGTAFRAPALAQSHYSAGNTSFINGAPVLIQILPVDNPIARLVGSSELKPEKARNLSLGAVIDLANFEFSVDWYRVQVDDRIVISSNFQDARITNFLASRGFPGIGAVAYITNAVDTTTKGIDATASYRVALGDLGRLSATLAANINRTRFDRIAGVPPALSALGITTPLFDLTQQVRFSRSHPRDKVSLNLGWSRGPFSAALTNTRYGRVSAVALQNRTPAQVAALTRGFDTELVPSLTNPANSDIIQNFGAKLITDLELSYKLTKAVRLSAGATNLFDVYPDRNLASTVETVAVGTNGSDNAGTLPYNAISPFGFSGRYVYARLGIEF